MKLFSFEKTLSLSACLAAVMLLALTPKASALSEVQTESWSDVEGETDQTLNFDKFDDEGGKWTLESVHMALDLTSYDGLIEITNDRDLTQDSKITFGTDAYIEEEDISLWADATTQSEDKTLDGKDDTVQYDRSGESGTDQDDDYVDEESEQNYIGTGTFELNVDLTVVNNDDFDHVDRDEKEDPISDGDVTLTYNYIPEPTSLFLLLMISGIAVSFNRRRRC